MKYKVCFEARQRNALGIFQGINVEVEAENMDDATHFAMTKLHVDNMETRFPLKVWEYNGICDGKEIWKQVA